MTVKRNVSLKGIVTLRTVCKCADTKIGMKKMIYIYVYIQKCKGIR